MRISGANMPRRESLESKPTLDIVFVLEFCSVSKAKIEVLRGHPGGMVLKFKCCTLAARYSQVRSWAQIYTILIQPCCGGIPHTKWRKIGTDVSSGTVFLNRENKNPHTLLM